MYAAREGKYRYVAMEQRYHGGNMPVVLYADMLQEMRNGNFSTVSSLLARELQRNIESSHQSILLLNRRGTSRQLTCQTCGLSPKCPHCDTELKYHFTGDRLHCHLCGYSIKRGDTCSCGGQLQNIGFGTQQMEADLQALFPGTQILRLDADTALRKGASQKILEEFSTQKVPILLGTQMVAKGLDFPNVTLVGVADADSSLFSGDFRARERTFALLTQVIGRSGRGEDPGRAVLQSFSGFQPTLSQAAKQAYVPFYEAELPLRKLMNLPPYSRLTRLLFVGESEAQTLEGARFAMAWLAKWKEKDPGLRTLGPAPAIHPKIRDMYRYNITLLAQNASQAKRVCAALLQAYHKQIKFAVYLTVDPDAQEG
jgi:primosomal protein N' (replication factor Y)